MKTDLLQRACDFIGKWEGLKLKAYKCPAGVWTIGYGDTHYLKQFSNPEEQIITIEKALDLLRSRVFMEYSYLKKVCLITINDNQIIALLSFIFNFGATKFLGSTLLRKLNSNISKAEVAQEFLRWNKIGTNPVVGLTKRREAEAQLFLS